MSGWQQVFMYPAAFGVINMTDSFTKMLEIISAVDAGAALHPGQERTGEKVNNAEVIEFLAKGGRSLYPSDKDMQKAANIFTDELIKHMKREARKTTVIKAGGKGLDKQIKKATGNKNNSAGARQARQGITSGLKKATKYLGKQMYDRAKNQLTTSGIPAKKVTEEYARMRKRRYGVNPDVVYYKSGILLNSILTGKVKVWYNNNSGIEKATKLARKL